MSEIPNSHRTQQVPACNKITLSVIPKDDEWYKDADPADVGIIRLQGDAKSLAIEALKAIAANFEHNPDSTHQYMFKGMILARRDIGLFHSVIMTETPNGPVTIRRRSWPANQRVTYISMSDRLQFDYTEDVYKTDINDESVPVDVKIISTPLTPLTPLDLAADDWIIVDNPNIVEETYEEPLSADDFFKAQGEPKPGDNSYAWCRWLKVVRSARTGHILRAETDVERQIRGLPTPWTPAIGAKEADESPVD